MKRYTVATLLVGALACSESNAPPVPPPVPQPGSFGILPAIDTVEAGESVRFVADREDSTVDAWRVSDSIARVDSTKKGWAWVTALAAGTVTVKAKRQADSGQATLVILPMPPPPPDTTHGTFSILPAVDTAFVAELVTFATNRPDSTVDQWTVSDSTVAKVRNHHANWANVIALAAGAITITASSGRDTARATLVVRPAGASWEAIDLGVLDGSDGLAFGIGEDGSVVGRLEVGGYHRGFVYTDGVMRKLPWSGGHDNPMVVGSSGKIAGIAYGDTSRLVIWDTPDAAPRLVTEDLGIENVVGINDRGDILITTWFNNYKYAPKFRAVLWRDNVRVDLGDLSDGTVVRPTAYATAWNSRGQVVGWSDVRDVFHPNDPDPSSVRHPFIWENGVMRDLGVLEPRPCTNVVTPADCSWGEATDINVHGVVVGSVVGPDVGYRAFIWENGVMRDLGVAPGHSTRALAINDSGQVMGTIDGANTFLWKNGQTQIIGFMNPMGLSPNGEVIGWGGHDAFVWHAGRLIPLGPGEPRAINGQGEITGWTGCCGDSRPMLWRKKS